MAQAHVPGMNVDEFFPVYNMLFTQINGTIDKDRPLTDNEIKILIDKLNKLDKTGSDMIYVFVRLHSLRHSDAKLLEVPYQGEKITTRIENSYLYSDVKFDIKKFPPILCRMLDRFSTLHLRKLQEEKNKNIKF